MGNLDKFGIWRLATSMGRMMISWKWRRSIIKQTHVSSHTPQEMRKHKRVGAQLCLEQLPEALQVHLAAVQKGLEDGGDDDNQIKAIPPPLRTKEKVGTAESGHLDRNFLEWRQTVFGNRANCYFFLRKKDATDCDSKAFAHSIQIHQPGAACHCHKSACVERPKPVLTSQESTAHGVSGVSCAESQRWKQWQWRYSAPGRPLDPLPVAWHDDTRCHELWAESFKTGLLEGVHLPNILRFIWYYDMILCDKKCTATDWMEKTFMILFHV